jgi:hypothetical protein
MPGGRPKYFKAESSYIENELFLPKPVTRRPRAQRPKSETPVSSQRLPNPGPQLTRRQKLQSPLLYSPPLVTPDELFLPSSSAPASWQSRKPSFTPDELFIPQVNQPPMTPSTPPSFYANSNRPRQLSIPRLALRVDTFSMQAMARTESPLQPESGSPNPSFSNSDLSAIDREAWSGQSSGRQYTSDIVSPNSSFIESPEPLGLNKLLTSFPESSTALTQPLEHAADKPQIPATLYDLAETDFTFYDPPSELQSVQNGTSVDIESILEPSIKRVRTRHMEAKREEATRLAVARGQLERIKPLQIKTVGFYFRFRFDQLTFNRLQLLLKQTL